MREKELVSQAKRLSDHPQLSEKVAAVLDSLASPGTRAVEEAVGTPTLERVKTEGKTEVRERTSE